jgi:cytochrome c-type biogenesis protein
MELSVADLVAALVAGTVSFFAPCVVPLLPAYASYIAGTAGGEPETFQRRLLAGGVQYVLGFSLVFIFLGVSAGLLGSEVRSFAGAFSARAGGVVVLVMGLALLGLLPWHLGDRSFGLLPRAAGGTPLSPLVLGVVFGTAWTPCVGPVLGSILVLAAQRAHAFTGGILLAFYSIGLGLPFLLAALLIAGFPAALRPLSRFAAVLSRAAGVLLVILGVLLITGLYQSLAGYLAAPFV